MGVLDHQVAVVTGAGRGIGRAAACALAQAGADCALISRTSDQLMETVREIKKIGRRVIHVSGDITHTRIVRSFIKKTVDYFGRIDVLVNNAGVQGPIGPLADVPAAEWVNTVHVNLVGTFFMCHAVLPIMIQTRKGKIINLSGGGATRARPFFSAYGVSKAAVVRLTETLAEEVAPYHIDVNAVAPGAVSTRMTSEILAAGEKAGSAALSEARRVKQQGTSPNRAAALIVFLASSASNGISGRLLSAVHDDWENLPRHAAEVMKSDLFQLRRVDRIGNNS